MTFQHVPVKAIPVIIDTQEPYQYMGFSNVAEYPLAPGSEAPAPGPLAFRWTVNMSVLSQNHSSKYTRQPGVYNGYDIEVGNWIAEVNSGMCYQIVSVTEKTDTSIQCVVQDMFRYNTFRDASQTGIGGEPAAGFNYVVFGVLDNGAPVIDPKPDLVVGPAFWENLSSRFNYIDIQHNFSLMQRGNTFQVNDIIAVDPETNSFVKASSEQYLTVGVVTSVSDTMPNWFTVNPVSKVDDLINYLPGDVGDIIYSDKDIPGKLTAEPSGRPVYLKLRNNGRTQIKSLTNATATPGFAFQINGATIEVPAPGNMTAIVDAINAVSTETGVIASVDLVDKVVQFQSDLIGPRNYLSTSGTTAKATINGVEVEFDLAQSWGNDLTSAGPDAMASAINATGIPGIVASSTLNSGLILTNTTGGSITIVNVRADSNGTMFAGANSASGLPLSSLAATAQCIVLTADDARAINLTNVLGSPLLQLGLVSAENAQKAAALYVGAGLRQASNTVCADLAARDALSAYIGDQAYVINSDDGDGNYVNQWSTWVWTGSEWSLLLRQSAANVDSKTVVYDITPTTAASFDIETITTGRRIVLISVVVTTAFNGSPTLNLGYTIDTTVNTSGLMADALIDLQTLGTYNADTAVRFGTGGTEGAATTGDVTLTGSFSAGGATAGTAKIIISYV